MKFEDLEVWQRAVRLSADIIKTVSDLKNFGFRDQVCRAALSIPSNIAEGFERDSARDSIRFLRYAKGSCGELRTQIYIGLEVGYTPEDSSSEWLEETGHLSRMLGGLIRKRKTFLTREDG